MSFHRLLAFENLPFTEMLAQFYPTGHRTRWASQMNIFVGAFFGRILLETGIAATIIRKTVELGGYSLVIILVIVI